MRLGWFVNLNVGTNKLNAVKPPRRRGRQDQDRETDNVDIHDVLRTDWISVFMLKNRKLFVFTIISLSIGIIIFGLSQQIVNQCEEVLKARPTIDVFPNSEILGTTTDRPREDY